MSTKQKPGWHKYGGSKNWFQHFEFTTLKSVEPLAMQLLQAGVYPERHLHPELEGNKPVKAMLIHGGDMIFKLHDFARDLIKEIREGRHEISRLKKEIKQLKGGAA